jgi:pilus assembly protein Flp/PilA
MSRTFRSVYTILVNEDGPTSVEYAVMLGLIVVACIAVVSSLAQSVSGTFSTTSSALGGGS